MKIDDAKAELARTALLMFEHNGTSTLDGDATLKLIDKIYSDFEVEFVKFSNDELNRIASIHYNKHSKGE